VELFSVFASVIALTISLVSYLFPRTAEPSVSWRVETHVNSNCPVIHHTGHKAAHNVAIHVKSKRFDCVVMNESKWEMQNFRPLPRIHKAMGDYEVLITISWTSKFGKKFRSQLNW
jgi:hypothetical protein